MFGLIQKCKDVKAILALEAAVFIVILAALFAAGLAIF